MGLRNEEIDDLITNKIKEMEVHINKIEEESVKGEGHSIVRISNAIGKLSKIYGDVVYYLGIHDGKPKNEGR